MTETTCVSDINPDLLWNYVFNDSRDSKDAVIKITYADGGVVCLKSGNGTTFYEITLPFVRPYHQNKEHTSTTREPNNAYTKTWSVNVINEKFLAETMRAEKDDIEFVRFLEKLIPYVKKNTANIKWNDAEVTINGSNSKYWQIRSGLGKYEIEMCDELGEIQINLIPEFTDFNRTLQVTEINKRVFGKAIVRFCGNEGSCTNPSLRKLFQAAIDQVDNVNPNVLRNCEMLFYDDNDNVYKFISGKGKHLFVIAGDEGCARVVEHRNFPLEKEHCSII